MPPTYCWSSLKLRSPKPPKFMFVLPRLLLRLAPCLPPSRGPQTPYCQAPVSSRLSNFRELLTGEVRRTPLLGNSVNKPPADVAHPSRWHHALIERGRRPLGESGSTRRACRVRTR